MIEGFFDNEDVNTIQAFSSLYFGHCLTKEMPYLAPWDKFQDQFSCRDQSNLLYFTLFFSPSSWPLWFQWSQSLCNGLLSPRLRLTSQAHNMLFKFQWSTFHFPWCAQLSLFQCTQCFVLVVSSTHQHPIWSYKPTSDSMHFVKCVLCCFK